MNLQEQLNRIQSMMGVINEDNQHIDKILDKLNPKLVFVHGDTTTAYISALAAFNRNIKVAHVEAGLRTNNIRSPFPEEFNRKSISMMADINFSPTTLNKKNLIKENYHEKLETI